MRKEIKELIPNIEFKQMEYQSERIFEILCQGIYKGYQFYIMNLGTHPTAYVEIPITNKLFGKTYNEIYDMGIDIDVHGGLTYSKSYLLESHLLGGEINKWFIGWDYAHYNDYAGYEERFPKEMRTGGKKWTTEEIFEDVVNAIEGLIKE